MKFQDSLVELRLRTPDEGADVGILLARKYWWPLLGAWAVFAIPFFVLAYFIPSTFWALVLFWWFKPLYERLPLQVVSASIFQQKFDTKSMLKGIFQYDTLSWLTIYRICPGRSTLTPIAALEGLDSGSGMIRRRRQLVKSSIINSYFLLHVGMFACEFIMICTGTIVYMKFFEPVAAENLLPWEQLVSQWSWVWGAQSGKLLLLSIMLASSAIIAPFYVCGGFGLYINRRIGLEGWDLYLGFQRMISRLSVVCVALLIFVPIVNIVAEEAIDDSPTQYGSQSEVSAEIDEIVKQQVFEQRTVRRMRPSEQNAPNYWSGIMKGVSYLIMLVLILLIAGLIVWVVIKLRIWEFVKRRRTASTSVDVNVSIFEDEQSGYELPSNVIAEASLAWEQGRSRQALSLLYQGSLRYLIAKHSCPIQTCDTERICARAIARHVPALSEVFGQLSLHWQQVAYGNKTLADADFQQLLSVYENSFA